MCQYKKSQIYLEKSVTFVAKKSRKTGFSFFPTKFQMSASQLAVMPRLSSKSPYSCLFVCKRCASYKISNSVTKKLRLLPESLDNTVFFSGVFHKFAEKFFAILICRSNFAPNHHIAVFLAIKGVPILKKANLSGKKLRLWPKSLERRVFRFFFRQNSS